MARNIKGLAKHIAQIMDTWEGTSCTLNVKTVTYDGDGQITGVSYVPHTIIGTLPAMPKKIMEEDTGWIEDGEITSYFACSTVYPSKDDRIIFGSQWFEVTETPLLDYDRGVAVGCLCKLRRVPNES